MSGGIASKVSPLLVCKGLLLFCLAAYMAVFVEIQLEFIDQSQIGLLHGTFSKLVIARSALLFLVVLLCALLVEKFGKRLLRALFAYRYIVALFVLAICVLLELSGSSLGYWASGLDGESGTVFGSARPIRSDEWLVFSPFALAQSQEGFPLVSSIIRGDDTITSMVYAQPSWSIATIFRPFMWGYLLLGAAKGLSFFWTARILALFLVTFECARLYTKDNRYLSALVAVVVSFSPIVLWWFAINGIVELFVFGQLLVLCLHRFLQSDSLKSKFCCSLLVAWFAGCFVMIMYPAWQVPAFYVFLCLGLWTVLDMRKRDLATDRLTAFRAKQGAICIIGSVVVLAVLLVISFWDGRDAIFATMNTVYPGDRCETGGNGAGLLFNYGLSPLLTIADFTTINQCEYAALFSLFPLGSILGVYTLLKYKDSFSGIFVILQAVFLLYACLGFPEWLAKITLLSNVTAKRLMLFIGFIEILLLARFLSLYQANNEVETVGDRKARPFAVCVMVVGALSMGYIGSIFDPNVTGLSSLFVIMTLVSLVIAGAAIGMFLFEHRESAFERHGDALCSERLLLVVAFCVVGVAGFFVNPVQQGLGAIGESSQSVAIQEIVSDDSLGKWVSLASAHTGQLLIANGAPTINSVNVYPDLDRWAQVDKRGNYVDVYNRYAHITVMLQESRPTSFELSSADAFTLYLDPLDLETLEVRYIYSEVELNDIAYLSNKLTLLKSGNGWFIYEYLN